jgi:UDP-N-acetylglucosamine 4,6-dehydratase/5-epimerase
VDLSGKTILLTGGTGSFGKAFIDRVLHDSSDTVIRILSRDEFKQSQLQAQRNNDERLRFLVGDVRDGARVARAAQGVDFIVHAAAMKQIAACEYNPFEAVQTNVLGAQNIVQAALEAGVPRVIAISTDKAVNPVNLYGATKLCAEKIFLQGSTYAGPAELAISCVRYGNVLGSRGSVVPLFRQQAEQGQLTITDERMTRFWITLDEAVDLVFHAMGHGLDGQTFIPHIPSMRVVDLAEAIAAGTPRRVVGARPGEKLHEMLYTADESRRVFDVGDVFLLQPDHEGVTPPAGAHVRPVAEGVAYTSDTNDWWLSVDDLRAVLTKAGV